MIKLQLGIDVKTHPFFNNVLKWGALYNNIDLLISDLIPSKDWLYFKIEYTDVYRSHYNTYTYRSYHNTDIYSRFYKTNIKETIKVSESEYYTIKYGTNILPSQKNGNAIILENGNTLRWDSIYRKPISEYNKKGELIRTLTGDIANMDFASIAMDTSGNIWAVLGALDVYNSVVYQFDYNTGNIIYEITKNLFDNEFCLPEHIISYDKYLYISDLGNFRIAKLNPLSKEIKTHIKFDTHVYQYVRFKGLEFAHLDGGVFIFSI